MLTDEQILATLRTIPRATTKQLREALAEDHGGAPSGSVLRTRLHGLVDQGRVGRHDRNTDGSPHFTWWVL